MLNISSFTYTLGDLQEFREFVRCNDTPSQVMNAWASNRKWEGPFPWLPYLEFMEKIKENENWPEEHFSKDQGHSLTFVFGVV